MNAKLSVFVICLEEIIYLSLYNFHDCTFKQHTTFLKLCLFMIVTPEIYIKIPKSSESYALRQFNYLISFLKLELLLR